MRQPLVWIVGRGGLLGSRLTATIGSQMPQAACWKCAVPAFSWREPSLLVGQFEESVAEFAKIVRAARRPWIVPWAAGAGVVGATEEAMQAETDAWTNFLEMLGRFLGRSSQESCPGLVFLSSSAGGTYGNCPDQPITEASACRPISAYGRNKLSQEALLQSWACSCPSASYLIGRISNLYGPGQNLAKPQGLISHISRSLIRQYPIHIFVPLDTIRDYLYVDDCAQQITHCLAAWLRDAEAGRPSRLATMKIFAAEQATSVAQIVGAFTRLAARRHPRVICAPNVLSAAQPRRLEFHSIVAPDLKTLARTPLQIGINQVHQYHLAQYQRGGLPATG